MVTGIVKILFSGVFADILPGYQKEEIMKAICQKLPEAGQVEGSLEMSTAESAISRFTR